MYRTIVNAENVAYVVQGFSLSCRIFIEKGGFQSTEKYHTRALWNKDWACQTTIIFI
jgi:hypothetical protein